MNKNKGQALIMTVIVFSGIMLGLTVIAGVIMINQIRQATGTVQVNQALYAADAGFEWELYRFFVASSTLPPQFPEGISIQTCSPVGIKCSGPNSTSTIRSVGKSGRASRAFEGIFE